MTFYTLSIDQENPIIMAISIPFTEANCSTSTMHCSVSHNALYAIGKGVQ